MRLTKILVVLLSSIAIDCIHFASPLQNASSSPKQLVFIQQINRHGARFPTNNYNITTEEQTIQQYNYGQLTNVGRKMSYELGKIMYKLYWEKLFGSSNHTFQDVKHNFYVRSSQFNRTAQSALSFCHGLFEHLLTDTITEQQVLYSQPPILGTQNKFTAGSVYGENGTINNFIGIDEVNCTITNQSQGDFLLRLDQQQCGRDDPWRESNYQKQYFQAILRDKRLQKIFLQYKLATGSNVQMDQFVFHYDAVICLKYLGFELPKILTVQSQTLYLLERLYLINFFISFLGNKQQVLINSIGVIRQIISNMKMAINNTRKQKWIIYSTSQVFILSILTLMDLTSLQCLYNTLDPFFINKSGVCLADGVPFGSSLVFEMYKDIQTNEHSFKMNYNGKYLAMPFCNNAKECSIDSLQLWFESYNGYDIRQLLAQFVNKKQEKSNKC